MTAGILLPNQVQRLDELLNGAAALSAENPNTDVTVSVIFRNGYPRLFESSAQERLVVPENFKKNF